MVTARDFTMSLRSRNDEIFCAMEQYPVVRYSTSELSNAMDNIKERVVEVMILSTSLHTKLALNFLCAYSIVNHQYWHLYHQHTRLVVQSLPLVLWSGMPYCAFTGEEYLALG